MSARVGIYGGTFNPIHLGHLRAAEEVSEALGLKKVILQTLPLPGREVGILNRQIRQR